jgi:hypothetical protein
MVCGGNQEFKLFFSIDVEAHSRLPPLDSIAMCKPDAARIFSLTNR